MLGQVMPGSFWVFSMRSAWWCPTKMAGVKLHHYFIVWSWLIMHDQPPDRAFCTVYIMGNRRQVTSNLFWSALFVWWKSENKWSKGINPELGALRMTGQFQLGLQGIGGGQAEPRHYFPAVEKWSHEGPKMVLKLVQTIDSIDGVQELLQSG